MLLFLGGVEKTLPTRASGCPQARAWPLRFRVISTLATRCRGRKKVGRFMAKAAVSTRIPNVGAMSEFIGAFDVPSKVTDYVYKCRFSHCWNGIATRHSDTMDCKFLVDGKGVILGLAHHGLREIPRARRPQSVGPRSQLYRRRISARAAGTGRRARALRCFRQPTSSA